MFCNSFCCFTGGQSASSCLLFVLVLSSKTMKLVVKSEDRANKEQFGTRRPTWGRRGGAWQCRTESPQVDLLNRQPFIYTHQTSVFLEAQTKRTLEEPVERAKCLLYVRWIHRTMHASSPRLLTCVPAASLFFETCNACPRKSFPVNAALPCGVLVTMKSFISLQGLWVEEYFCYLNKVFIFAFLQLSLNISNVVFVIAVNCKNMMQFTFFTHCKFLQSVARAARLKYKVPIESLWMTSTSIDLLQFSQNPPNLRKTFPSLIILVFQVSGA